MQILIILIAFAIILWLFIPFFLRTMACYIVLIEKITGSTITTLTDKRQS